MSTVRGIAARFITAQEPPGWSGGAALEHDLHAHIAVYSLGISWCFYPEIYSGRTWQGFTVLL